MATCLHCGATVPDGAVYCGNCGASLNAATASVYTTSQNQNASQSSTSWTSSLSGGEMQVRLEKAMKRAEQLSYAAAILGVIIIVVILVLYLLP